MSITFYSRNNMDNNPLTVNMANMNALDVLDALGTPNQYTGQMPVSDFRVLCKRALLRLDNLPSMDPEIPTTRDGNFIECGRPAGYLRLRIRQLLSLANSCIESDQIIWA